MRNSLISRLDAGDRALFARCSLTQSPPRIACSFWRAVTHLGGARFSVAASLLAIAVGGRWRAAVIEAISVLVISHLVVQAVKRSVSRPRPSRDANFGAVITAPDRFSFPSGHAAASASLAIGAATVLPQWSLAFTTLAILVSMSRVVLGVHFPGDVIAGQLIALGAWAVLSVL
ncbi:MAG TPA: phosphatase PAP2 family protein [Gemmatimonas sp.]|nr:phosphatase PAP2 family protein [Gemmatimonas sp.]